VTSNSVETQGWIDLEIHHYPDSSKSRGQYFPLLELSVREDPYDDRNAFYYARELFFYNQPEAAAKEFKRYLALPTALWNAERARAYRYLAQCEQENAEHWLKLSIAEDQGRREPLVDIALYYYAKQDWQRCYDSAKKSLEISDKPLDYLCEEFAWGELPYDLVSISAYHLGNVKEAIDYAKKALEIDSNNERLINNLKFYSEIVL
jgi:tetratricopeptide (TPR) repeat protein